MRALSVRQPYAELILRGIKTMEYRSRPTRIIGERFYLYAAKQKAIPPAGMLPAGLLTAGLLAKGHAAEGGTGVWSADLAVAETLTGWMIELAAQVRMIEQGALLPTGVIVGSAVIADVSQTEDGVYRWHLAEVRRASRTRKPTSHPQPVWFRPFEAA